jgi:hypothetical protein
MYLGQSTVNVFQVHPVELQKAKSLAEWFEWMPVVFRATYGGLVTNFDYYVT